MASNGSTWRFPRHFWMANVAELFELVEYFMMIMVAVPISKVDDCFRFPVDQPYC